MPPRGPGSGRGPRGLSEKPKDRKKVLLRLWTYLYAHKWMALGAILLTISSNLLALLGPYLSGRAIDAIGMGPGEADFPAVFLFCALMIGFYALSSALSYLLSILMIHLSQKIVYQMRKQVFDRLTELPVGYFDTHQTGDIVSRISYDIDTVNASLSNDLLQIAASVITVLGSLVMMIAISPLLVLVFAVTIPMSILFTRYMTKSSFGIYILHYPVLIVSCCLLCHCLDLPAILNYIIAFAVEIPVTFAVYEMIKRIPVVRFLVLGMKKSPFNL